MAHNDGPVVGWLVTFTQYAVCIGCAPTPKDALALDPDTEEDTTISPVVPIHRKHATDAEMDCDHHGGKML